jgi:hypothetical protein
MVMEEEEEGEKEEEGFLCKTRNQNEQVPEH